VPPRSAEGDEERLNRQKLVVERVAIVRNANEGIDMIDHVRGEARSIAKSGRVAVGTGGCPRLPRTALRSVGGRPRSRGAAVTLLHARPAQTTSLARLFSFLALAVVGEASKASIVMAAVAHPCSREEQP
jgi:hypothetical protein